MLGLITKKRLQRDAPRQQLGGAALGASLPVERHTRRRWLALVCHGAGDPRVRRQTNASRLRRRGISAVLSVLLFIWLKRPTGRRRPCQIEPHCWATLLPPDQFSFPSGHTMTAFAVAIAVAVLSQPHVGLLFCALSIAMSRVLLGMHFLSDVVAGALIGTGLGYLGYFAFQ